MELKRIIAILCSASVLMGVINSPKISADENKKEIKYATGLIWESQEEFESKMTNFNVPKISPQHSKRDVLPSSFDITTDSSTSSYIPPIGYQGGMASCTSWAITYYQFTYEVNKLKGINTTQNNIYSPKWTYNYLNGGVNTGTSLAETFAILKNQGAMKLVDLPYETSATNYSYDWPTNTDKMIEALDYRLKNYSSITCTTSNEVNNIKAQIANGKIGVIQTNITNWNIEPNSDGQYVAVRGSNAIPDHAMAVVGYDDNYQITINGKTLIGAFKLANSWGANWKNNGYIWVSYDALNYQSNYGTDWQNSYTTTRGKIFYDNVFYFINVTKCDVYFVSKMTFMSNDPWNLKFYCNPGSNANECKRSCNKEDSSFVTPKQHYMIFDYFDSNTTYYLSDFLSNSFSIKIKGRPDYRTYRIKTNILDNNGELIAPLDDTSHSMTNGEYLRTTNINLAKGRVTAYDNANITFEDSHLVQEYTVHNVEFSNLQKYLADFNNDNNVDIVDVILMNSYINNNYQITDYIDEWECSLVDIIESQYNMSIEEFVSQNYYELSQTNTIPIDIMDNVII